MKDNSGFRGDVDVQEFRMILSSHNQRVTAPRIQILSILKQSKDPLTISEIHSKLSGSNTDLATVYRTLNLFAALKIVSEIDFRDDYRRFELTIDRHHHHHIVCRECGKIDNVEPCGLEEIEKLLAGKGYKEVTHSLEFFGVCERCCEYFSSNKAASQND